jgi:invasion protein IalB
MRAGISCLMPSIAFCSVALLCLVGLAESAVAQTPAPRPAPQKLQPPQAAATPMAAPLSPAAAAQALPTVQPANPAQGNSPQRTTATYEDWIVQCETQSGGTPARACEMTQVTQFQGKNQPFTRIAVLRPTKDQARRLIVQVPVNVSFSTHVRIQINEADQGLDTPFARCTPNGCFAEMELKDETLKKFRSASGPGKLSFADAGGHNVAVPLSFNGFSPAFDALIAERE